MNNNKHITVLLNQAVDLLNIKKDSWYIDATFGHGGHTKKILEKKGKVIAFDFDLEAIEHGKKEFADQIDSKRLILIRENFSKINDVVKKLEKITQINGILFDFGTNTQQLKSSSRGFSFEGDGVLDMRMDDRLGVLAKDLLAIVPVKQLEKLFKNLGGEIHAKKIAKAIKESSKPIVTNKQLSNLIIKIKGKNSGKLHPATKVFQALRIAVNTEIDNIKKALPQALDILSPLGRIITISFHDGEDREVKQTFKKWTIENRGRSLTKKPIIPTSEEIKNNNRSRSAKMRVFIKQ